MLENTASIEKRYQELTELLEQNAEDYQKVAELAKERSDLEPVVHKTGLYRALLKQQEEARELEKSEDSEIRELAVSELSSLSEQIEKMHDPDRVNFFGKQDQSRQTTHQPQQQSRYSATAVAQQNHHI